jgi:ATP-dependent exoDNAse (exonuclease V) beta subunit
MALEPSPAGGQRLAGAVVEAVRDILDGFSHSSLPARLSGVAVLAREAPILHWDAAGQVWSGTCDLLFRDASGIVVADYKTEAIEGDAADAALPYRAQIGLYVEALARAFPSERVRGEILFVRSGLAVPIAPR